MESSLLKYLIASVNNGKSSSLCAIIEEAGGGKTIACVKQESTEHSTAGVSTYHVVKEVDGIIVELQRQNFQKRHIIS
jgi:hypothetical protein